MRRFFLFLLLLITSAYLFPNAILAQDTIPGLFNPVADNAVIPDEGFSGIHQAIKTKFIEGSAVFMSFIALTFIVGLAFCLERIVYLNLAQINTRKFLSEVENRLNTGDWEGAKNRTQNTRGPVASIYYQALNRIDENVEVIDKSITAYGSVQVGLLEKNLSWITLFIAAAPSLGFLGTVIGMIQAFDNIQAYGDINPSIVAGGMKLALITTVGGLIVALILQFFYNYILTKVEGITSQMEDDSISIMDTIIRYKNSFRPGPLLASK